MVYDRWRKLYSAESSLGLDGAFKMHMYKQYYCDDSALDVDTVSDD